MKLTINTKTYNLPNELVIHINQQQRSIAELEDKLTDCENDFKNDRRKYGERIKELEAIVEEYRNQLVERVIAYKALEEK